MSSTERGQGVVETLLVALILLVPLMWLLGVLADLHRGAIAATAAVREAGSDAASSIDPRGAADAVQRAVHAAFADQGLDPARAAVAWSATPGFARGGRVRVRVDYPVTVVQFPFLGRVSGPAVLVSASHVARIDPYRSRN
ncbi:MAG: pilus assembly protein [Actinomycetota bacterium]|nr:pilus assembly protein [Actinomycetota bacterium]